jgi:hypothetical protein
LSQYYQLIYDILCNKGEEYGTQFPEINEKNVFSISSLSWSANKQLFWKQANKDHLESKFLSLALTRGKAIHEFLQSRLVGKYSFVSEYPLMFKTDRYKLIGHIDVVNFKQKQILEFKSTISEKGERFNQWIIQCGAYCKALEIETGFHFNGSIFCMNEFTKHLTEYQLSDVEIQNSWITILSRAEECYNKLYGVSER